MEKIKNLSLRKTIVLYISIALVISFFLSVGIIEAAHATQQEIWIKYFNEKQYDQVIGLEKKYGITSEISRIGNSEMTEKDAMISEVCDFLQTWTVLLVSMTSCITVVFLFYKHKIREPLEQLSNGSKLIAQNELDFLIEYQNKDEMGRLCAEFERMRKQLLDNNRTMWEMIEKEKALRAAIAHDIRSPLAILKGYQEMLLEFIPEDKLDREKLLEILQAGLGQIDRLNGFVDTMRKLSSLEEREIDCVKISLESIVTQLCHTAEILGEKSGKQCIFYSDVQVGEYITVDIAIIYEVYENLLSNALRYAKKKIEIEVSLKNNMLQIALQDDGEGFTEEEEKVTKAYYHANPMDDFNHFGLGLYISRIYCEKHNGKLLLGNTEKSGAYAKARFKIQ